MEIHKLNCPSCGAPISIPEDVDQITCTSCSSTLAVKRGDGYVALKMAEKVAQVIQQSGQATQSAIRDGTEVTRKELQRLQIRQELSMAEMRLSGLRSEIREVQRMLVNPTTLRQIRDLYLQEYYILEKIRGTRAQFARLDDPDPEKNQEFLKEQLSYISAEQNALKAASPLSMEMSHLLTDLNSQEIRLLSIVQALKIQAIKAGLRSFQTGADADKSMTGLVHQMEEINQDLKKLSSQSQSPEISEVKNELQSRYSNLYKQWVQLEQGRIKGSLESVASQPASDDLEGLIKCYTQIQNDLKNLVVMQSNPVINQYRQQLQERGQSIYQQIGKQQKRALKEMAKTGKATLGSAETGTAVSSNILKNIIGVFHKKQLGIPASVEPLVVEAGITTANEVGFPGGIQLPRPPLPHGVGTYIKGVLSAAGVMLVMFCASFAIYMFLVDSIHVSQNSISSLPMFGIFLGYVVGAFLFFRTIAPGIRFLPPLPKVDNRMAESSGNSSRTRIGILAGVIVLVGAAILQMAFILALPGNVASLTCALIIPLGAILAFIVVRQIYRQL